MNKSCFAVLLACSLFPSSLHAAPIGEVIAEMAGKCWKLPEKIDYQKASAIFEVTYNADGELLEIITVEYRPVREAGKVFALSAQQALLDCANKTDVKSRTIRVVMNYTAPRSNEPLIMKRSLR